MSQPRSIILNGPQDVASVAQRASWVGFPCTVTIREGVGRSLAQNRLAQQWAADVSSQMGDRTPEEARGYFKLHHGVPIRREEPIYAEAYDRLIRPLPYQAKLEMMQAPIDFPVTRDMTIKQLTRYLDSIQRQFSAMGVHLTDPEALKYRGAA